MGIILDTSVLIAGERRGEVCKQSSSGYRRRMGNRTRRFRVVTLVEVTHGIYRARTDADRERRRAFSQELRRDMAVFPVIAELAGRIEGEQAARGISIAFEDLLIGATALHINYAVITLSVRHFQMIPGLEVVSF